MLNFWQKLKTSFRSWVRRNLIKIKPLDELYKNVEKLTPIPQETVYTPELEEIPINRGCLKHIKRDKLATKEIYTTTLSDVFCFPVNGAIMTPRGTIVAESIKNPSYKERFSVRSIYSPKYETISGTSSIFRSINPGYQNIYHSVIDYLPRVYLLNQPEYANIDEIKLLIVGELTDIEKFFLPKLMPGNVRIKIVEPNKIYCLEKFIFPSFISSPRCAYLPKEYLSFLLNKLTPKRKRKKINRIFISRKPNTKGLRYITNEEELLKLLKQYGFSSYYMEDLSFLQKIELIYDAECVIGVHGGGLTNLIFSSNIKVLELFPTDTIYTHFYYLSKAVNNSHFFLCNNRSKNLYVDFSVNIEGVSDWLKSFINSTTYKP